MKTTIRRFLRHYRESLRNHLNEPARSPLLAQKLGLQAVAQGVETLGLAKIHEQALAAILPPEDHAETIRRAETFFAQANAPIERTHCLVREATLRAQELEATLDLRTGELAAIARLAREETRKRQSAEEALKTDRRSHSQSLKQFRRLFRQTVHDQESERKKISHVLQNQIVQILAAVHLHLALLKSQASRQAADLDRKIAHTQRLIGKSVDIAQRYATQLRPSLLDDLGLLSALQSHFKKFTRRTQIRVDLRSSPDAGSSPDAENLSVSKRTALYRVIQTALATIAQHTRASLVTITLDEVSDAIRLEIHHDGPSSTADHSTQPLEHLGLFGMRERIEMAGGHLTIESHPDRGATLHVHLPLTTSPANAIA